LSNTDTTCETSPAAPDRPLRSSRDKTLASGLDPKPEAIHTKTALFQPCPPLPGRSHPPRKPRPDCVSESCGCQAPSNTSRPGLPQMLFQSRLSTRQTRVLSRP